MEKKVGVNEFINQVLLKVEEGKVFLDRNGIKMKVKLDDVRIMSDGVSVTFDETYIKLSTVLNQMILVDLVRNETYVYEDEKKEVKIEITPDVFYIKMNISQLKPISLEALLRSLEALQIPHSSRYLNRIDVDITKCNGIQYDTDDGLQVVWGEVWNDHELRIKRDAIIYDCVSIDISNNSYFISFEKGIMSVML
jgi:hypothetical protein